MVEEIELVAEAGKGSREQKRKKKPPDYSCRKTYSRCQDIFGDYPCSSSLPVGCQKGAKHSNRFGVLPDTHENGDASEAAGQENCPKEFDPRTCWVGLNSLRDVPLEEHPEERTQSERGKVVEYILSFLICIGCVKWVGIRRLPF